MRLKEKAFSGMDEGEGGERIYDKALMKRLWDFVYPQRRYIIYSLITLPLVSFTGVIQPYIIKIAIDKHIITGKTAGLGILSMLFLMILCLEFFFRYLEIYFMQLTGQRVVKDLRMHLFSHLQRLPVFFFEKTPVGKLITRLTSDVEAINELFMSGIVAVIGDLFHLLFIITFMIYLNVKLTLIFFTVAPLIIAIAYIFRRISRDAYRNMRSSLAEMGSFLQECVSGITTIKTFNIEEAGVKRFNDLGVIYRKEGYRAIISDSCLYTAVEIIGSVTVAMILWYGGGGVVRESVSFGVLVAFIEYVQKFFVPIRDLSAKFNVMQSAMASWEKITKLMDIKPEDLDGKADFTELKRIESIEFRNVSFSYDGRETVLKNISFKVNKGERVAIIGATGAGKSSLIKLLLRFYDVDDGSVLINGVDIRNYRIYDIRRMIGVVFQDIHLLSGTIMDNVLLKEKEEGSDEICELRDRVFYNLIDDYGENVGEGGRRLSTGEKQLLAIARAIVYDPDVIVLDEATSSVDAGRELYFRDFLKERARDRIVIIIAHRLHTVRDVDRIILIHNGRIREIGGPEELLRKRGYYWQLYQIQLNP